MCISISMLSGVLLRTVVLLRSAAAALLVCAAYGSGVAFAQVQSDREYQAFAQDWLRDAVVSSQPAALRMEVAVGVMDSRLKLAPCANVEAYLPPGVRLWGRTRVGLRCVDGMVRWNVSMPATVKAFGAAWVLKTHVSAGTVLTDLDMVKVEVDWAEESSPVVQERAAWLGQVATRLLTTGQTLRQGMIKPAQVFQAGSTIRVVAQGVGFQLSGDAQALSAGVVGQPARVRMENGRVASGLVLDARTVKIEL